MLDRAHRLTSGRLFASTIRRGHRAGTTTLVVHLATDSVDRPADDPADRPVDAVPPRVGLVVGKAVGNAVVRSQVKRRIRHTVRDRLESLPDGALLVVRALPAAATASSNQLATDLDHALRRVLRPGGRR